MSQRSRLAHRLPALYTDGPAGVDLNRNFGGPAWEFTGDNPCDDLYSGPSAFSEPETDAVRPRSRTHLRTALYL